MQVPFLDLKTPHRRLRGELAEAMEAVMEQTAFAGGPFAAEFEASFASFCGARYGIGVGSGTEALWLALLALDVGPGDEVITVAHTFIATAEAISFTGATPVFVDIESTTYTMDPERLAAAITPRTRAIIPVHIFGQCADMDPICAIAEQHGIPVIEDAAQAHGASYGGRQAGSLGEVGCFSFYPGKNLGAYGEAGALVTDNPQADAAARMLRDHGQPQKYRHEKIGWNARLDGLQAAALSVKLPHLAAANQARRQHAQQYSEGLGDIEGVICPAVAKGREHVFHLYVIRVADRDGLQQHLQDHGIACGIHYPTPLHVQPAYTSLGYRVGDFPVSEACCASFLSLPMFPELTSEQIDYVVQHVTSFVSAQGKAPLPTH